MTISPSRLAKWGIRQLITMSIVLGVCLTALFFAHFYVFWFVSGYKPLDMKVPDDKCQLESIMYLHIFFTSNFLILLTCLTGYFWENLQSSVFEAVIFGTQIIALLMVVFNGLSTKVPGEVIVVLVISFVYFIILDVVKMHLFKC